MKLTVKTTLAFTLLITFSITARAQGILGKTLSKAKEKIEQKMEQKAEEKIEEKIDEKIDEDTQKREQQNQSGDNDAGKKETAEEKSQRRTQGILKGLGISGEPVPVDDNYSFTSKVQMHLENFDKSGKKTNEGEFITYMNPKDMNFAYEVLSGDVGNKGTGIFILDFKNKASIILSEEDGKKSGLVYGLNFMISSDSAAISSEELEEADFAAMNPYVSKTGRTKKILGYTCEEFRYDNPEEKEEGNYWITKDLDIKTKDFFGNLFKSSAWATGMGWGYLMESESLDRETGERSRLEVTDIDPNANKNFSLSDYQITNLGSINVPAGDQ